MKREQLPHAENVSYPSLERSLGQNLDAARKVTGESNSDVARPSPLSASVGPKAIDTATELSYVV